MCTSVLQWTASRLTVCSLSHYLCCLNREHCQQPNHDPSSSIWCPADVSERPGVSVHLFLPGSSRLVEPYPTVPSFLPQLTCPLWLSAVGVGSWCFHMTLLYEMQLLDELPMIYSTCVFVYCLYECFKQEKTVGLIPITLLFVFSMSVSLVMYGVLVACLVMRSIFIVTWVYPWLRPLCYASLAIFMLGFLLWNIDNIFCEQLRTSRRVLPPGLGVLTQFHAWWHIFTGLGSYLHILLSLQIRSTFLKRRAKVKFLCGVWPTLHIEPQRTS
uniref:Alkaline ceramidase n=1 Tax=Oryzias latipes TaxID=8090 RepID=A0A3B3HAL2_ORYLA